MEKTLLLAIIALSINAFAQNNKPKLSTTENFLVRTELEGRTPSKINSDRNFGQAYKHQTPDQGSLQLFDSIYYWDWDTISTGWKNYHKSINYVYDSKNNLTSELDQIWNGSLWENSYKRFYAYDANNNC